MNSSTAFHPASPILGFCPPTLPAAWYHDPSHFAREVRDIHARNWVYVGRVADLPLHTLRRVTVAWQNLILVRDDKGSVNCFHNTCRHRGSELCIQHEQTLKSKLITCPYHEWAYDLKGQLVRVPHVPEAPGFEKSEHGLFSVAVRQWNGLIFVCLADTPPDFATAPDMGLAALQAWPMESLVTGHRLVKRLACNWKIFWENYNECLHCPGIHPSLCDMVPVYGEGLMAAQERPGWTPEAAFEPPLKAGARTWTKTGQPCGPEFPGLSPQQRAAGYSFITLMPTMYIVAHVDYVRLVSLRPIGSEETELTAEWLFSPETLAAPGFDLGNVTDFATTVMIEDGAACEMNQRGLRSSRYRNGTLMPQEFDVFRFQQWVRGQLGEPLISQEEMP